MPSAEGGGVSRHSGKAACGVMVLFEMQPVIEKVILPSATILHAATAEQNPATAASGQVTIAFGPQGRQVIAPGVSRGFTAQKDRRAPKGRHLFVNQ